MPETFVFHSTYNDTFITIFIVFFCYYQESLCVWRRNANGLLSWIILYCVGRTLQFSSIDKNSVLPRLGSPAIIVADPDLQVEVGGTRGALLKGCL